MVPAMEPISARRAEGVDEPAWGGDGTSGQGSRSAIEVERMDGGVGGVPGEGVTDIDGDRRNRHTRSGRGVTVLGSGGINDADGNRGALGKCRHKPNYKNPFKIFPCQRHFNSLTIEKPTTVFSRAGFAREINPKNDLSFKRSVKKFKVAELINTKEGGKKFLDLKQEGNGFTGPIPTERPNPGRDKGRKNRKK